MEDPGHVEQLLTSLDGFKDWSNYLLVTTVAALGWKVACWPQHVSFMVGIGAFTFAAMRNDAKQGSKSSDG